MCFPLGCNAVLTRECMSGSAMYLIGTFIPYSHARRDLSSLVEMNRLSSSQKVRVLIAAKW